MARRGRTTRARAVVACAGAAVLAAAWSGGTAHATGTSTAHPATGTARLVVLAAGPVADAGRAARSAGARVVAVQPAVGSLVVDVPRGRAADLAARIAADPAVGSVSPDRALQAMSLGADSAGQRGSMGLVADVVGARSLWRRGITGAGVGVALIDTGVAPVQGLLGADKVVVGPDLSFESQNPALRNLDTFGHGTHMAGIIAGREGPRADGPAYAASTDRFLGVAPDATLVSLKLADRYGAVDVARSSPPSTGWSSTATTPASGSASSTCRSAPRASRRPGRTPSPTPREVATRTASRSSRPRATTATTARPRPPRLQPQRPGGGRRRTPSAPRRTDDDRCRGSPHVRAGAAVAATPDVVAPGVGDREPAVPGSYVSDSHPSARAGRTGSAAAAPRSPRPSSAVPSPCCSSSGRGCNRRR